MFVFQLCLNIKLQESIYFRVFGLVVTGPVRVCHWLSLLHSGAGPLKSLFLL
jgi:hypothetical protein